MQRSIDRQRNRNDASSVFMKSRACSCPWLSSTSCSLGTNQKLHTFCSKSNFTLRLKISIFLEIYSFSAFSGNKRKWQLLVVQNNAFFWGEGELFCTHYFWVFFFTLLGERFWDKNYAAYDLIFVKELFFPHKFQSFLFAKKRNFWVMASKF